MTSITVATRRMVFDESGNKVSDVVYYWLSGKREDLMKN